MGLEAAPSSGVARLRHCRSRRPAAVAAGAGTAPAGISHLSLKPWAVSPSAAFIRDRRFSTATIAVSSTSCAWLRWARSRSVISSVTLGGVAVIDSAYSRTSRSSSVKARLSRHRGTARIFSAGTSCCMTDSQYPKSMHHEQPIVAAAAMTARSFSPRSSVRHRSTWSSKSP